MQIPSPNATRSTTLEALQRTLEFEEELAEKFGGGTINSRNTEFGSDFEATAKEKNDNQIVSDIRRKYEKKFVGKHGGNEQEKDKHKDLLVTGAGFNFRGIISSCFEPHLAVYVFWYRKKPRRLKREARQIFCQAVCRTQEKLKEV